MRYITYKNVKPGMELARPLLDEKGNILLNAGREITNAVYNRLDDMEIQGLYINDEIGQGIEAEDLIDPIKKREAMQSLMKNDIKAALKFANFVVDELRYLKGNYKVNIIDIKNNKNYTCKHMVSCCVYSVVVGVAMGLTEDQLRSLATAAVLHDIGKLELPESILHKQGRLTEEEMKKMKEHPKIGYEKLTHVPEISSVARNAVLYHHECINGTGYYGVKEEQQTIVTRILRLVDTYDALTSVRKFRPAFTPSEAIEHIMGNTGTLFDSAVVAAFTSKFPLYPVGTTIKLSNGEVAVVFSNKINNLRPVIRKMDGNLVDLSTDVAYRSVIIKGLV